VDGPGETDNEADDPVPPPPPVQTKPTQSHLKPVVPTAASSDPQQDSAQIAKKIKELIHLKGVAQSVPQTIPLQSPIVENKPSPGEIDLQRSDSVDSIKRGSVSIRSASQASLSGKF
jgi:hypothetical protein